MSRTLSARRRVQLTIALLLLFLSRSPIVAPPARATTPPATASITIDAGKAEGSISPMLYGQFAEFMYEDIKGGLYAELIRDRSFEEPPNAIGLSRYWERDPDDRNDDYALTFHWDNSVFYPPARKNMPDPVFKAANETATSSGSHSLRMELAGDSALPRHGVHQGGIPVRQGVAYHGYLWLKTENFTGSASVALERDETGGETYAAAEIEPIGGDWRKYEFTLKPMKSDPLAKFSILVRGRGRLWVDQVSLLPGDAVGGVRADVFEKVKALRPAFIRWPGGNVAQDYHWIWGTGPRDRRPVWINLSWANEPEPSDFGTDEFIEFCRRLGAEPSLTVNVEGRGATPQEAAAWVEYCNGPATSKYGAMRAANGHPAAYNVKYWEVGNEIWGTWVRAHSDAATYGRNFNRYAQAMRAVDPTIKLIGCGDNNLDWDRTVLKLAGTSMDFLAIHHYYGTSEMHGDELNLMAHPLFYERFYPRVAALARQFAPDHPLKLAINEWNTSLPVPGEHSMEAALYAARLMNVFERSNEWVAMSAVSDMVNGWTGGIIQASRHGVFVTPTYLVNQLYSDHLGRARLRTKVESPAFDTSREGRGVPFLDAVASRSADHQKIFIKMVNTDQGRALQTRINLTGVGVSSSAELETLTADSLTTANSFRAPDAVSIKHTQINSGPSFVVELPEHSVSVLTLSVKTEAQGER